MSYLHESSNPDRQCCEEGCTRLGQHTGAYRIDGSIIRRKRCNIHHHAARGVDVHKLYRKNFCENVDGRLGYKCTATIVQTDWQLTVDHIDGNPHNNDPVNLQTLCFNCHAYKTLIYSDWKSPGRKSLKEAARNGK